MKHLACQMNHVNLYNQFSSICIICYPESMIAIRSHDELVHVSTILFAVKNKQQRAFDFHLETEGFSKPQCAARRNFRLMSICKSNLSTFRPNVHLKVSLIFRSFNVSKITVE